MMEIYHRHCHNDHHHHEQEATRSQHLGTYLDMLVLRASALLQRSLLCAALATAKVYCAVQKWTHYSCKGSGGFWVQECIEMHLGHYDALVAAPSPL